MYSSGSEVTVHYCAFLVDSAGLLCSFACRWSNIDSLAVASLVHLGRAHHCSTTRSPGAHTDSAITLVLCDGKHRDPSTRVKLDMTLSTHPDTRRFGKLHRRRQVDGGGRMVQSLQCMSFLSLSMEGVLSLRGS
jgi:hypothetical protein